MHVGSRHAVFPDNFYSGLEGNLLGLNKGQKMLLEYWEDFVEKCEKNRVDTVVLDGDIIHAQNRAEYGRYTMTTNLDEQVDAAYRLLRPLCDERDTYVFDATGYHESLDSRLHKALADRLGAKYMGALADLIFSDRRFQITHGTGGASIYRETKMGRDGFFMKWAEGMEKLPRTDVLVKGHFHEFIHIHAKKQHLIQLPCWQTFVPWQGALSNIGRMQPDIGGVIVFIDEDARIRVWHFLYEPVPRIGIKEIEA